MKIGDRVTTKDGYLGTIVENGSVSDVYRVRYLNGREMWWYKDALTLSPFRPGDRVILKNNDRVYKVLSVNQKDGMVSGISLNEDPPEFRRDYPENLQLVPSLSPGDRVEDDYGQTGTVILAVRWDDGNHISTNLKGVTKIL